MEAFDETATAPILGNDGSSGTASNEGQDVWICPFAHKNQSCETRYKNCARLREHFKRVHKEDVVDRLSQNVWDRLCELTSGRSARSRQGKYDRIKRFVEKYINQSIIPPSDPNASGGQTSAVF